jgi:hypothetical protein
LAGVVQALGERKAPGIGERLGGWFQTTKRRIRQNIKSALPGSLKSVEFMHHRYPPIPAEDVKERLARFQQVIGSGRPPAVEEAGSGVFRISA